MSVSIICPGCGKRLKAPDKLVGKAVPCPACGAIIHVAPGEDAIANFLLDVDAAPSSVSATEPAAPENYPLEAAPHARKPKSKSLAHLPPLGANEPPGWSRHLHWLLMLALIPLALTLLDDHDAKADFESRLQDSIAKAPPERGFRIVEALEKRDISLDALLSMLPDERLIGAFLPRHTVMHWLMAAGAATLFAAFLYLLTSYRPAQMVHLLVAAAFTGTIGLGFLLLVQKLAALSHFVRLGGHAVVLVVMLILRFIDFSYQAALDPQNGFLLSFIGFTLGVGFCEEVCKALPLLWHYRQPSQQGWHSALLLGLASGAAFGVGEGIIYSSSFYNGISGPGIYVVRFVSCVALHALWTGSVAITLDRHQHLIQEDMSWYEYFPPILIIVAIPMVLHGLYDTLLKRAMNGFAILVALLSFLFLAFQIGRHRGQDDVDAEKAMLREYKKRRKQMASEGEA